VIEPDGKIADIQRLEYRVNHRWHLGVMPERERILADHVDIALIKLAKPPTLGALAAIHALHLIAPEREREFVLVLGDIARQRHGEVKAQRELGQLLTAFFQRAGRLGEIHLALGFAA